ncbi:MAG: sulfotransferase [Bacteroidetes bacterium]|nr:sulfotransferase [Bacteroidota bacterium]
MIASTIKHRVKSFPEIQRENPNRLFVFAESRSGSTWLINTLASHRDIGLLDEVINPDYAKTLNFGAKADNQSTPEAALQKIENQISRLHGKYKGCKILFPQSIRFIDFYEFVLNYRNAFFIILTRKNSIRAEISGLIANEHARWHLVEKMEKQQISVDPAFLYERLQWRKHSNEFCISMLETYCNHILHIEYNELFSNMEQTLGKISAFLAISPAGYHSSTEIKSNPFPLTELISNYDECLDFFKDKPAYLPSFINDSSQE